jgi:hypothetical protein
MLRRELHSSTGRRDEKPPSGLLRSEGALGLPIMDMLSVWSVWSGLVLTGCWDAGMLGCWDTGMLDAGCWTFPPRPSCSPSPSPLTSPPRRRAAIVVTSSPRYARPHWISRQRETRDENCFLMIKSPLMAYNGKIRNMDASWSGRFWSSFEPTI